MATTVEIDDELYYQAAAIADRTGRHVNDLVAEGLRLLLQPVPPNETDAEARRLKLKEALEFAHEAFRNAPPGPSAREILEEGRSRLERK